MRISAANCYKDLIYNENDILPDSVPLNIVSGGCHLYGYLLKPGGSYEGPHPCVVMFHGFPGYTTNNDLEYALMRMGCVVMHVNHRGAWGSEGSYLFSNLVDDAAAIAKYAHNQAIADRYNIDPDNIFLIGHSMGGMTALNTAARLDFIKGVAAIAPYDLAAAFHENLQKDLFVMIEQEGQCLKMNSASEVYENAQMHHEELSIVNTSDRLKDKKVLLIGAVYDNVAPPDIMIKPLYNSLKNSSNTVNVEYTELFTNHGLCSQRTELAVKIGNWLENIVDK